MDIATSFLPVLQVVAAVMTEPTAENFRTLITGWLLAPRRTILGMVRASGVERHHAAFHRIFASAAWSIEKAGLALFDRITASQQDVFLTGDDTLLSRSGLKVFGAGMHRDPVLSSRSHTVTRWGHCWVLLCVVIESRFVPGRRFSLPVLCRLYLNKKSAERWRRTYRKKSELMIDMLNTLNKHVEGAGKSLCFIGDSAYTAPAVLAEIPRDIDVIGRVVANVRLHAAPPAREPGQAGRPRKRGERLPTPKEMLDEKGLRRLTLDLYDTTTYRVRLASTTAYFYKAPDREVHLVALEHLTGGRDVEVFYSTRVQTEDEVILEQFSWRWSVEVTNQDAKQHLGVDEPQNWTTAAARRTAPAGFLLYSLIVWWHERERLEPAPPVRRWRHKRGPSFADMLASLRRETLENSKKQHLLTPEIPSGVQKFLDQLINLLTLAA